MSSVPEKNLQSRVVHCHAPDCGTILLSASAIVDWRGAHGTALLVEMGSTGLPCTLATGLLEEVRHHPAAAGARRVSLPGHLVIPGLVNAHTHLDLTHIGPLPHDPKRGFIPWAEAIRTGRSTDPSVVAGALSRSIDLLLAGGTVAAGDIAGTLPGGQLVPWEALKASGLLGVCFLEFFGIGGGREAGLQRAEELAELAGNSESNPTSPRLGIQPHAPYSVDLDVYRRAADLAAARGIPIATHLAENPEEREFIAQGTGPARAFLGRLGIWDQSAAAHIGKGNHPVQHLESVLRRAPFTLAHVNDADDRAIEILAESGARVVYCPRASEYFGAEGHFGPHRYQQMIQAGINVAIGTDSIANLPAEASEPARGGVSVLDEIRLLFRRDGTDPLILLRMATVAGAMALGIPEKWFRIERGGELAGLVTVPLPAGGPVSAHLNESSDARAALTAALMSDALPELLLLGNRSCATRIVEAVQPPNV